MSIKTTGYWLSGAMSVACLLGLSYVGIHVAEVQANEVATIKKALLSKHRYYVKRRNTSTSHNIVA